MANTTYNRDDLLIAEFKEAFNEFDKVFIKLVIINIVLALLINIKSIANGS